MRRKLYLTVCALLILIGAIFLASKASADEIDAHYIANYHKRHEECQYNQRVTGNRPPEGGWYCQGKNLQWRTDSNHEWVDFQREARQLRAYLLAVYVARVRENLVDRWSGVAQCESGGNWSINTGNGYYGGLQFSLSTWRGMGGQGYPHQQPAWYQAQIADRLRISSGLHHWPNCGRYYG